MNSETWLVEHHGSRYVAKSVRDDALAVQSLLDGATVAEELAARGVMTGPPVRLRHGELIDAESRTVLLHYVKGGELDGESEQEQLLIADTLASVHSLSAPEPGPALDDFFPWLRSDAPELAGHAWLRPAIDRVRRVCSAHSLTWAMLHTDPSPEAFIHDLDTGTTGLIDWAGAQRGPVLYDLASAVMYLGGPTSAAPFIERYAAVGPLEAAELRLVADFSAFRWAVQAAYFAGRLDTDDLTGITDQTENEAGLARGRRGLADLGYL